MKLVPDQPPLVRAAMVLADFALELRLQGRRVDAAEQVLEDTPPGQTRSATMARLARHRHDEMLRQFDELAAAYADLKVAELTDRNAKGEGA